MVGFFKILITFLLITSYTYINAKQQTVRVVGRLICGDKPLVNEKVKLWNDNTLGTDDQLASVKTNSSGYYDIQGGIGSIFTMDVKLKFYTDCEDGIKPCQRKIVLGVPDKYISKSDAEVKTFDGGVMNLAFKFPDESRDCLN
ncbi:Transthyretin-like family-containing protein [Strongyloides ratti]|uniref:Transthyretin-like family-containing protein n=1 Tax=Strongyloides ratti TaxID=34506 RepID=A0A090L2U3_STRRB|nr:Transthyretin-like family-containing protein [Strongyloides ratti]CEF62427.1 Transthyretin-like family-containing protein [Strongyloides ratti]